MNVHREADKFKDQFYDEHKRACFHKLSYRSLCGLIVFFEFLYWIYYFVLFLSSIFHHQRVYSTVFAMVALILIVIQILFLALGVIKESAKLIQVHLILLGITFQLDVILAIGFIVAYSFPSVFQQNEIDYGHQGWDATKFIIAMGSCLAGLFLLRLYIFKVVYQYMGLLRMKREYKCQQVQTVRRLV